MEVGVQIITQLGGRADFYVLLFGPCIWPDAISRWIRQRYSNKFCSNPGKIKTDTLTMIKQTFGEESMSRTRKVQTYGDRRGKTDEEQIQSMLIVFIDVKGIVHKFAWQVKQSILHTSESVRRLRPELWRQKLAVASHHHTVSHLTFHQRIFLPKTT
jgi:hypothetical protein